MREVSEADFGRAVLDASKERPIVVDFWSARCQPCLVLSPVLEALEAEADGAWELVKINTDQNPQLAADYRVMSIPSVKAFVDRTVVKGFAGAYPRDWIEQWLSGVLPSEADVKLRDARRAEEAGELERAESGYRAVIEAEPDRPEAHLGLGRIALGRDEFAAAREHLEAVPELLWSAHNGQAEAIWLQLTVADLSPGEGEDSHTRYERGLVLAARGELEEGLTELLAVVAADREWRDGLAGRAMVRLFSMFDEGDPRADSWRARLGRTLYV